MGSFAVPMNAEIPFANVRPGPCSPESYFGLEENRSALGRDGNGTPADPAGVKIFTVWSI